MDLEKDLKMVSMEAMEITTIILSSAVVSAVVSLILGQLFDKKKYLRDKKLAVYVEFLDQLEKLVPDEEVAKEMAPPSEVIIEKIRVAVYRLEKHVWKIKLISTDHDVQAAVTEVFELCEKYLEHLEKPESEMEYEDINNKLSASVDEIIKKMNKDINQTF